MYEYTGKKEGGSCIDIIILDTNFQEKDIAYYEYDMNI
jgi:hypothetical protein